MATTYHIPAGTKVLVRKAGSYSPWVHHTTTKAVPVPAESISLSVETYTFDALGYEIIVRSENVAKLTTRTRAERGDECGRCGGRGYLSCFKHVQGGVCFKCGGSGNPKAPPVCVA